MPSRPSWGADLLLGLHPLAHGEAEEGLPAGEVAGLGDPGSLAGVNDDHAFGMLDRKGVDRKRLRPLPVKERVHEAAAAPARAFSPLRRDGDGSRLDGVDLHLVSFFRLEDSVRTGGAKPRRISSTTPRASCSSIGPPVISNR
jgi:hypothetical protein